MPAESYNMLWRSFTCAIFLVFLLSVVSDMFCFLLRCIVNMSKGILQFV